MKWQVVLGLVGLLGFMGILALWSVKDDSATNDEIAHIAAGYSYLVAQDYRLNPEHPPIAKDLAAFPLLFMDLEFPWNHPSWTEHVNDQWGVGQFFLYEMGNDADAILFWGRIPMILLLVALGGLLFHWSRQLLGTPAAFFVLVLFVFSPNFLAHGRLVTTDVAATLGVVLALYWFLKFLYVPSRKHVFLGGIALAFALLLKFSTIILLPVFGIVFFLYWYFLPKPKQIRQVFFIYSKGGMALLLIAVLLLGIVYQAHILQYPAERQLADSKDILGAYYGVASEDISFGIADSGVFRPYAHYVLGLLRSSQRVQMQTAEYFLGETGPTGWPHYFPVLYATKIPLAFHILSVMAIMGVMVAYLARRKSSFFSVRDWARKHFSFVAMGVFVVAYLAIALSSPMQIGFRHLLPILPFVYIFVGAGLRAFAYNLKHAIWPKAVFAAFLGWYIASSLAAFPHYLSYYNEFAGGASYGYKVAAHSNYDWGQDLKRLVRWKEERNIDTIYLDFFGRADPSYYLGESYVPWRGSSWWKLYEIERDVPEDFPHGNYLAVSAHFLASGGWTSEGYSRERDYAWLDAYEPIGRAGQSIVIYYIP